MRVEWFKDLGDADGRLGLFLDVFNVFNESRATLVEDRAGSAFETPLEVNQPRTYRRGRALQLVARSSNRRPGARRGGREGREPGGFRPFRLAARIRAAPRRAGRAGARRCRR